MGTRFRRLSSWRRKEIFRSPIRTKQERLSSGQAQLPALSPSHWIFINLFHVTSDAVGRLGIDDGLPYFSAPSLSPFEATASRCCNSIPRHMLSCILQGTRLIMSPFPKPHFRIAQEAHVTSDERIGDLCGHGVATWMAASGFPAMTQAPP